LDEGSCLTWNRTTGEPLHNFISWQDVSISREYLTLSNEIDESSKSGKAGKSIRFYQRHSNSIKGYSLSDWFRTIRCRLSSFIFNYPSMRSIIMGMKNRYEVNLILNTGP
jgi:hypothetical protein